MCYFENAVNSTLNLWAYIFVGVTFVLAIPIAIYAALTIKYSWNSTFLVKRKKELTLYLVIVTYASIFIAGPLNALGVSVNCHLLWHNYVFLTLPTLASCQQWLMILRFWLYYYDSKLILFNRSKQWRMAINLPINKNTNTNKNKNGNNTNWYFKHLSRWGNERFILKFAFYSTGLSCFCFSFLLD